jgi:predicted AAA+ superfamily ATPase
MDRHGTHQGDYVRRVVDVELDDLLVGLPAISLEGPKGVGKTATAVRRASTVHRLDDPATLEIVRADMARLTGGAPPILVDEWQRLPASWDAVRRAVDDDRRPGRFLLTGSASPSTSPTHSGAGRIVRLRMRPLTLTERGVAVPTVSVADLLSGARPPLDGSTAMRLEDYVAEIVTGGFPGMRSSVERIQRRALDGYLDRIVDTDLPELGVEVRRPGTLRRWLAAYAAATGTSTSFEKIRDAATAGDGSTPAKSTTIPYRTALERLWVLDPLDAWMPSNNHLRRLTASPKHHLADPALAARLVGAGTASLLSGQGPSTIERDGTFLGSLFESLATLNVRVLGQAADASTFHFRTRGGEREVDLILERDDRRVVALEVKLSETIEDHDLGHLRWLRDELGDQLLDAIVLTTGRQAYRRQDGIGVVPLALLGP